MTDFRRTNLEGVKVVEYRFLRDPTLPSLLFVSINHHLSSVKSRPSPFVLPATYSRPPYPRFSNLPRDIYASPERIVSGGKGRRCVNTCLICRKEKRGKKEEIFRY